MSRKNVAALVAALGLGALPGCRHATPPESVESHAVPSAPVAAAPAPAPAPEPARPPTPAAAADLEALVQGAVLSFDYDAASLRPESQERLRRIAEAMRAHPEYAIHISGNCDERGTEEYNLVLGQKRAEVARRYLLGLGVEPGRVSTMSYGKERPLDPAHTEEAWARNRRDDLTAARRGL